MVTFFSIFIGVLVGIFARRKILILGITNLILARRTDQNCDSNTMVLKIETTSESLYCYENYTNEYICHGDDLTSIKKSLNLRYPTRDFLFVGEKTVD